MILTLSKSSSYVKVIGQRPLSRDTLFECLIIRLAMWKNRQTNTIATENSTPATAVGVDNHNVQQVRPSSGTGVYPHMPIIRPHAARFHERRISSVTFTWAYLISTVMFICGWAWPARCPIRPIFGFWASKIHKNVRFPALDADEPPSKI